MISLARLGKANLYTAPFLSIPAYSHESSDATAKWLAPGPALTEVPSYRVNGLSAVIVF